jgi:zinc/manganese transport system substrate-binding protein
MREGARMRPEATRRGVLAAGAAALAGAAAPTWRVCASFSVLADITSNVAPAGTSVAALAGAGVDPHGFDPAPAQARGAAGAGLMVVNGLGFDGWAVRFARAAGFAGEVLEAGAGVALIGPKDAPDPHAWLDAGAARTYAQRIAAALTRLGGGVHAWAAAVAARAQSYDVALVALDSEIRTILAPIPPARRVIVTAHDAFAYFGRAYGLRILAMRSKANVDSAARTAALIRTIRSTGAAAAFPERALDARGLEIVRAETAVKIGGALHADALTGATGAAPTYIDLMRSNARTIAAALI